MSEIKRETWTSLRRSIKPESKSRNVIFFLETFEDINKKLYIMEIIIINENTRNRFKMNGKCVYMYSNGHVTRLHIKSTFSEFEQEEKQNEEGLKSIGLDVDNEEIAYRKLGDLVEYFIIPEGFGVQISE